MSVTVFNPEGKPNLSYGETLGPAMGITDQEDADQYFREYVAFLNTHMKARTDHKGRTAEDIARINLGYYAGYYDHETRLRVESLFKCRHPWLGAASDGVLTPDQAFEAGRRMAVEGDPWN